MVATETVVINTTTGAGGVVKQGSRQLALLAPLDVGATVSANVVRQHRRSSDAADEFGDGSRLAIGAREALGTGLRKVFLVGVAAKSGSPFTDTVGDNSSEDEGTLTAANLPITSVTSVTVDGAAYDEEDILFTEGDPSLLSPTSGQIYINTHTGAFKTGDTTSGSGSGIVIVYESHDWDAAFNKVDMESYECHAPAGFPFNAQNFGIFQKFIGHGTEAKKMTVGAYDSGVAPGDVQALTEAIRNGRGKWYAYTGTGDATSAFAANEMLFPVNATTKEQKAPASITFTDTYTPLEFGDEENPASGTFHNFGANAVFRDRGGTWRISNDRASTGLTDFERFHSTRRSIRFVENEIGDDLLAARRGNGTALPFTQAGIDKVQRIIENTLNRMRQLGIIDQGLVVMPTLEETQQGDRLNRVLRGVEVNIRLTGQIHMFVINLNVGV